MKDIDDLFGSLKRGPLKDIFNKPKAEEKPKDKDTEPKWPSVRVNINK